MNAIFNFIIRLWFASTILGLSTIACCAPLAPVATWCEKQQQRAKTPKLYWRWAWGVIAVGFIALFGSITLSIFIMRLPQVQGCIQSILCWFTSLT